MISEKNQEKIKILDEMSKVQIEQLHNTTLNISKQSFEIKKLCILTLAGVITISLKKETPLPNHLIYFLGVIITILFYIIDAFTYNYQRGLRNKMIIEENEIYKRNYLKNRKKELDKLSLPEAFFNSSQILYYILIVMFLFLEIVTLGMKK